MDTETNYPSDSDAPQWSTGSPRRSKSWKWIVMAAALLTFLITMAAPPANWVAITQLRLQFPSDLISAHSYYDNFPGNNAEAPVRANRMRRRFREVAATMPDNMEIQIAAAIPFGQNSKTESGSNLDTVTSLMNLRRRFPRRPELYAIAAKYATWIDFSIWRPGEDIQVTISHDSIKDKVESLEHSRSRIMAANRLLEISTEGAAIDPQNGIFPLYKAAALFALKRDSEAFTELHHSAHCVNWNEYGLTETLGRIHIYQSATGDFQYISATNAGESTVNPQYDQFTGVARVAIYLASQKEKLGDTIGGLKIRQDVLSIASALRAESQIFQGNLSGNVIDSYTGKWPGGVIPTRIASQTGAAQIAAEAKEYGNYLTRIGAPGELARFNREINSQASLWTIVRKHYSTNFEDFKPRRNLMIYWLMGAFILSNAIATMLSILFIILVRWRRTARRNSGFKPGDPFTNLVAFACFTVILSVLYKGQTSTAFNYLQATLYSVNLNSNSGIIDTVKWIKAGLFFMGFSLPLFVFAFSFGPGSFKKLKNVDRSLQRMTSGLVVLFFLLSLLFVTTLFVTARAEESVQKSMMPVLMHQGRAASNYHKLTWPPRIMPE